MALSMMDVLNIKAWVGGESALDRALRQLPIDQGKELLDAVQESCELCNEANGLAAECRSEEGWRFEPAVIESGQLTVAVRATCEGALAAMGATSPPLDGGSLDWPSLAFWSLSFMRGRVQRMREFYRSTQMSSRGGRSVTSSVDALLDPWREVPVAEVALRLSSLEALALQADRHGSADRVRRLFGLCEARCDKAMVSNCFRAWAFERRETAAAPNRRGGKLRAQGEPSPRSGAHGAPPSPGGGTAVHGSALAGAAASASRRASSRQPDGRGGPTRQASAGKPRTTSSEKRLITRNVSAGKTSASRSLNSTPKFGVRNCGSSYQSLEMTKAPSEPRTPSPMSRTSQQSGRLLPSEVEAILSPHPIVDEADLHTNAGLFAQLTSAVGFCRDVLRPLQGRVAADVDLAEESSSLKDAPPRANISELRQLRSELRETCSVLRARAAEREAGSGQWSPNDGSLTASGTISGLTASPEPKTLSPASPSPSPKQAQSMNSSGAPLPGVTGVSGVSTAAMAMSTFGTSATTSASPPTTITNTSATPMTGPQTSLMSIGSSNWAAVRPGGTTSSSIAATPRSMQIHSQVQSPTWSSAIVAQPQAYATHAGSMVMPPATTLTTPRR